MAIVATSCPTSLPLGLISEQRPEETLDVLCTLYDLYDTRRWIARFIAKHKGQNLHEVVFQFEEVSEELVRQIKRYSDLVDDLMKEKALHPNSPEEKADIWP